MMNAAYVKSRELSTQERQFVLELRRVKLGQSQHKFNDYVRDTFLSFAKGKKEMVFLLDDLTFNDKALTHLLFHELKFINSTDPLSSKPSDRHNIVRSELFQIFDQTECIMIYTTRYTGEPRCDTRFSFVHLLNELESASFKRIILKATRPGSYDEYARRRRGGTASWLDNVWSLHGECLTDKYAEKHLTIFKGETKRDNDGWAIDSIIIDRNHEGI